MGGKAPLTKKEGGANAAEGSNAAKRPCRGVWGHPPPEYFENFGARRCHLFSTVGLQ